MKMIAMVSAPDNIEVTAKITMPLAAWKRLREDLAKGASYIASDLSREIHLVVMNAEQTFYATEEQRKAFSECPQ